GYVHAPDCKRLPRSGDSESLAASVLAPKLSRIVFQSRNA
ncbi:MAG: hypothetical protein ACI9EB_002052, partial [Pseudomonas sp.]